MAAASIPHVSIDLLCRGPLHELASSQEEPKLPSFECRICHEEEEEERPSKLASPCDCSGTLKYVHHSCLQRWCAEKGDAICEICHQPYKDGYSARDQPHLQGQSTAIDFSDIWAMDAMERHHPRILSLAAAQSHLPLADFEQFRGRNFLTRCHMIALFLIMFLLLGHATAIAAVYGDEDDLFVYLLIFVLRLIGFLLPCFIMIRAMSIVQQGQQDYVLVITSPVGLDPADLNDSAEP